MNSVRLENWYVRANTMNVDGYTPPELINPQLVGNVYGHPTAQDGDLIVVSTPIGFDRETNEVICKSRRYILGECQPEYLEEYPDAKERLIKSLGGKI